MSETARTQQKAAPYEQLGGDAAVRALVDRFYDRMDADPAYAGIRVLHPADLAGSREKLYCFLSGWLGGPPLYAAKHGHPRLRSRHLPFAIGETERDQWIDCMRGALADCRIEPGLSAALLRAFYDTADFMRNRAG